MNYLKLSTVGAALAVAAFSTQASAATALSACTTTDIVDANVEACSGFFAGNILSGNSSNIQAQIDGLAAIGFAFDGDWAPVELTKISKLSDGFTYDFDALLNGTTFIGIHKGGANGSGTPHAGTNGTAFYRIDANNLDTIQFAFAGGSSAVLYSTGMGAVPEPSTWALLMLGFAAVGFSMRRSKDSNQEVRVRYA